MNPTFKNLPGNILSNNKASYLKSGSTNGNARGIKTLINKINKKQLISK